VQIGVCHNTPPKHPLFGAGFGGGAGSSRKARNAFYSQENKHIQGAAVLVEMSG
jgi:hypothetical protein